MHVLEVDPTICLAIFDNNWIEKLTEYIKLELEGGQPVTNPSSIKVLHVNRAGGAAEILAVYRGDDLIWVQHAQNPKATSITGMYPARSFRTRRGMIMHAIWNAHRYDIIHLHTVDVLAPIFRLLGKKVVVHYHGGDIRNRGKSRRWRNYTGRGFANIIFYNNKDMGELIKTWRPIRKVYVPNMIDENLFRKEGHAHEKAGLIITYGAHDKKRIKKELEGIPERVFFYEREIHGYTRYEDMAKLLGRYKTYYDIRYLNQKFTDKKNAIEDMSLCALQMLACGGRVYHQGEYITEFPAANKKENVLSRIEELYRSIM